MSNSPSMSTETLATGLYEQLLDEDLAGLLNAHPELRPVFGKLDDESTSESYSQFLWHVIRRALPVAKPEQRFEIVNSLIRILSAQDGLDYTLKKALLASPKPVLTEIREQDDGPKVVRPSSPLSLSSLLTGSSGDPQLEHELRAEMMSADRVDILVSFIKWAGLRLLQPAFEHLAVRKVPVRIITTSYMGASDPEAVEWLSKHPGFSIKVSYEVDRTRLHAKAYHFHRNTGFSTAYIGSANMSRAAMTSGLEWTVKVTRQDMPHILERFSAEFASYWENPDFTDYQLGGRARFEKAIATARKPQTATNYFFADISPRDFQKRILEALEAARENGSFRNLVVAATGTGKTVISAFDYARHRQKNPQRNRLLFVVHRKEILQQARDCFRAVLRDANFGELLVDGEVPGDWNHVFASVQSLTSRAPWERFGRDHFHFVIVDEAHHGKAPSYRPLFDHLEPQVLLGLTATPERADGSPLLPDFDNRFAAEIRLPEALEEKLLCPFHYFGVTDPLSVADESFWSRGKYDVDALTRAYTGDDIRARQRLDIIIGALNKYQPNLDSTYAVGFCASVQHAEFMADKFREAGHLAETVLGSTPGQIRHDRIQAFRRGEITFLFTVDVFSEGIDIPEINLVMFLRPTESLTVFLQQLGRGLRHSNSTGKECLTVLDFVGQCHRRYRVDRKFTALLSKHRRRIDQEIEFDFPNLPPGCNIHLERVAREHILRNIKSTLCDLQTFIPETIQTFRSETGLALTFGNFVRETGICALDILKSRTWSEWKRLAHPETPPENPDLLDIRKALRRISLRTDPRRLDQLDQLTTSRVGEEPSNYTTEDKTALHYLFWSRNAAATGITSYRESLDRIRRNPDALADLREIIEWRRSESQFTTPIWTKQGLPNLHLHATYGLAEIKAAFGLATLEKSGSTGVGVLHDQSRRTYIHLVTFNKEDADFAPTTRYKDYLISPRRLHWESQSVATRQSPTGQNYIHFKDRGYTILFFARLEKRINGETSPFLFLGEADNLISYDGDRPITMVWNLRHSTPAEFYESARIS